MGLLDTVRPVLGYVVAIAIILKGSMVFHFSGKFLRLSALCQPSLQQSHPVQQLWLKC